jgi:hypothetical protein
VTEQEEPTVTYRRIEPGLANLIKLGLDTQMPQKIEEWKENLDKGRVTGEMRDVFVSIGWLSSNRDRRLSDEIKDEPVSSARGKKPVEE